jgi:hypothetical protein
MSEAFANPVSASSHLCVLHAYLAALNALDLRGMTGHMDEALEYHILPRSLGHPTMNKEQYVRSLSSMLKLFREFTVSRKPCFVTGALLTAGVTYADSSRFTSCSKPTTVSGCM